MHGYLHAVGVPPGSRVSLDLPSLLVPPQPHAQGWGAHATPQPKVGHTRRRLKRVYEQAGPGHHLGSRSLAPLVRTRIHFLLFI